ncbi:MAG TPA: anion transporter [Stellaceae bacterium]|jgi:Na+/H+ antiporter NhaD/arsenite permease-like protein|nr:anion transporter [Stellaceae bacterium]
MLTASLAEAVFAITFLVVATGRLPGFGIDRTGAALLGAAIMVGLGVVPLADAYRVVDWNTITLLLGTMMVVAHMKVSGFFGMVANAVAPRIRRPISLLALVMATSAVASAFLVNDTICLILVPLVLDLVQGAKRNPVPYLLGLAAASNIGSVATSTGNPQNIMIASFGHLGFAHFAAVLAPVSLASLAVAFLLVVVFYRHDFLGPPTLDIPQQMTEYNASLVLWTTVITIAMVVGFFTMTPIARPAILAGAILLLAPGSKARAIYAEIDWSLLVLFAGLFIVVAGAEKVLLTPDVLHGVEGLNLGSVPILAGVAAVLSNLVSNVPAVLLLRPFIEHLSQPEHAWLTLAASSTLAGNLTILGSVANLIVVQRAAERGIHVGFGTHLKLGVPLTLLTLAVAIVMLR